MEERLDQTLKERADLQKSWEMLPEDADDDIADKAWEDVVENAGKIRGMLEMLAIMRSTSAKVELLRARARLKYGDPK